MELTAGVEPTSVAYETTVLPLNYASVGADAEDRTLNTLLTKQLLCLIELRQHMTELLLLPWNFIFQIHW